MILDYLGYYSELKKSGVVNDESFITAQTLCDSAFLKTNPTVEQIESYEANRITKSYTLAISHPGLENSSKVWEDSKQKYLNSMSNVRDNSSVDDFINLEDFFANTKPINSSEIDQVISAVDNLEPENTSELLESLSTGGNNFTSSTEAAADDARKVRVYGLSA
jgi:hypothetical protein